MTEQMLSDVSKSSDLKYVDLRYFNVSGADPDGEIGQSFPEVTHLIKVASEVASGKRELIKIMVQIIQLLMAPVLEITFM
jgi:UDP-glucose 4-epimerase